MSLLQFQVDEVKGVMTQNIEKVLERGDRLDDLMDKTEELEASVSVDGQDAVWIAMMQCGLSECGVDCQDMVLIASV